MLAVPEPREPHPVPSRSLYWLKTTDPDARIVGHDTAADVRVLLPDHERFRPLRDQLTARGIAVRSVKYLLEREEVTDDGERGGDAALAVGGRHWWRWAVGGGGVVAVDVGTWVMVVAVVRWWIKWRWSDGDGDTVARVMMSGTRRSVVEMEMRR